MKISNQVRDFANDIIDYYAKDYKLNILDVSIFDRHKFAALLMSEDLSLASEATGPDNPEYDAYMLPALQNYLKHSTDPDAAIEFNNLWRDCTTNYFIFMMQEIINDICNARYFDAHEGLKRNYYKDNN